MSTLSFLQVRGRGVVGRGRSTSGLTFVQARGRGVVAAQGM